jgi:hypothetical protein
MIPLQVGDRVRCEREAAAIGTWARYAGRVGVIVTINRQQFDNGAPDHVEYGVDLNGSDKAGAWFLPTELVAVVGHTAQPPRRRLGAVNGSAALRHRAGRRSR